MSATNNKITGSLNQIVTFDEANSRITGVTFANLSGETDLGNVEQVKIFGGNVGETLSTDGNGNLSWSNIGYPSGANATLQYNANGDFGPVTGVTSNGVGITVSSSNIHIMGGSNGQILSTNGAGNLSWVDDRGYPEGLNSQLQYNANGVFGGIAGVTSNGVGITTTTANLSITGGSNGQYLRTDGNGTITWSNVAASLNDLSDVTLTDTGSLVDNQGVQSILSNAAYNPVWSWSKVDSNFELMLTTVQPSDYALFVSEVSTVGKQFALQFAQNSGPDVLVLFQVTTTNNSSGAGQIDLIAVPVNYTGAETQAILLAVPGAQDSTSIIEYIDGPSLVWSSKLYIRDANYGNSIIQYDPTANIWRNYERSSWLSNIVLGSSSVVVTRDSVYDTLQLTAVPQEPVLEEIIAATDEPTGFPDPGRTQTTITFDSGSRLFTIAPTGASFDVWVKGTQFTKTGGQNLILPDISGLYYISYTSAGALQATTTFFDLANVAPVAYVYWNATDQAQYYFGDERHGTTMDWQTHEYLHRTRGAAYAAGFTVTGSTTGDGSSDTDAQIGTGAGTFYDEDIQIDVLEQTVPAQIPVLYRSGAVWKYDAPTNFPYKLATTTAGYNLNNSGNWSVADLGNNSQGIMWLIATNDVNHPLMAVMGQAIYNNIASAQAATWDDMDLSGLPSLEFRVLWKLIFKTNSNYTNTVKLYQEEFQDWRTSYGTAVSGSSGGGVPGGANLQLQYNANGFFGGITGVTSDGIGLTAAVANVHITGGSAGQILSTDGSGNLSWTADTSIPSGSNTQVQFNNAGAFGADSRFTWDSNTAILSATGVVANTISAAVSANLGAVGNVTITGGSNGQYLRTDGNGNLVFSNISVSPSNAAGSNTQIQYNSNGVFAATANFTFRDSDGVSQPARVDLGAMALEGFGNGSAGRANPAILSSQALLITTTANGAPVTLSAAAGGLLTLQSGSTARVVLQSGSADADTGTSGNVDIFAGEANTGGHVNITGGTRVGEFGAPGNVYITGGINDWDTGNVEGWVNFDGNVSLGTVANVHIAGGSNGQVLTTNGNGTLSWTSGGGTATPAGANTQVQFNDAGSFGASANFTFSTASNTLTVTNIVADGSGLTAIAGANVTGTVANAAYAEDANTAALANSVTLANVVGAGNIAGINLDGNVSNVLAGDGTWIAQATGGNATPAGSNTQLQFNANGAFGASANLTFTDGDGAAVPTRVDVGQITVQGTGNGTGVQNPAIIANNSITITSTLSGGEVTLRSAAGTSSAAGAVNIVAGSTALANSLAGAVAINGGDSTNATTLGGFVYIDAGQNQEDGGQAGNVVIRGGEGNLAGHVNILGGVGYDTDNGGNVDISGGTNDNTGNIDGWVNIGSRISLGPVGNVVITGGNSGQMLSTDGAGNLSWTSAPAAYGDSNVVTLLSAFGSNTITTTGNVTFGNVDANSGTVSANAITAQTGNITAVSGSFIGKADGLTNIPGANVTGTVDSANTAATVTSAAQANITSVGTLTGLELAGNANIGSDPDTHIITVGGLMALTPITTANIATLLVTPIGAVVIVSDSSSDSNANANTTVNRVDNQMAVYDGTVWRYIINNEPVTISN